MLVSGRVPPGLRNKPFWFLLLWTTYGCPGSRELEDPGDEGRGQWESCRFPEFQLWHAPMATIGHVTMLV